MSAVIAVLAALRLATPFADGMVLQRERPVAVWGFANAGETVRVAFAGQDKSVTAGADGRWRVSLEPLAASAEGRDLAAETSAETVRIGDVLVGEVWLCSGQSNMELPLCAPPKVSASGNQAANGPLDAALVNRPEVRAATVPFAWGGRPKEALPQNLVWKPLTPGSCPRLSAVAFHFAVTLNEALRIPIGVVVSCRGGTPIQPWISAEGFSGQDGLAAFATAPIETKPGPKGYPSLGQPRILYNGKIAPLVPMTFRGVVWYQGESNRKPGRGSGRMPYDDYLTALYDGWAKAFENPEMPFYFVQIAPYHYNLKPDDPELRNGRFWVEQARFARRNPNAAIVTSVDVGEADNIHPGEKRTVALRLAAQALARTYGRKDVPHESPELTGCEASGESLRLAFAPVKGWVLFGQTPAPFEIAGADGAFVPAQATYEKNSVTLRAEGLSKPRRVRYLWNWCGRGPLKNENGYPLMPFEAEAGTAAE